MPGRPLLLDLRSQSCSVCQSCLLRIRRQAAQPWVAAFSSQASRSARSRPQPRPQPHPRTADSIARPPSGAELKRYFQGLQELQGAKKDEDAADVSVRYFEQDERGRTELPDEQSFGQLLDGLDKSDLIEDLSGIEKELETQEEKNVFRKVMREMGGVFDNVKSEADVEKDMAKMRAYSDSIDARIEEASVGLPKEMTDELRQAFEQFSLQQDFEESALMEEDEEEHPSLAPLIPERPWTLNQRKKISRLNKVLAHVFRGPNRPPLLTKKSVSSVFKAYHTARLALASGWSNVSLDVWDFLWTVLSADETINLNRLSRISMLARDMVEARVPLSPSQQLLTIEAVFVDGWESKAIDNWKRCMGTLGDDPAETYQDFWELGVRMFCRVGDMEQAERAVSKLLTKQLDPRILMPLIRTFSEQGTPESQKKAWTAYRQMRELLGRDMKLSDYDQVVSYFLTTHQMENALYAFVDMMSDGEIDLTQQKYMPSVVANKFFLGKWLKRLIGAGDMDGALNVAEYMRSKGVEAAPIHLNGLIGAWQRSGGVTDLEKADKVAWAMIESRIRFVRTRKSEKSEGGGGSGRGFGTTLTARSSSPAPWPRATLETFCLVAENYRMRDLRDNMEALWDAFHDAEISPDAFMMNQLLESHIQAGEADRALALYQQLVAERGIAPDPHTYSALWKTLAVNRLHVVPAEARADEVDTTRRLFAETVKFRAVFEPDGMDGQLARKMLHTFRRLQDQAGFVIALAALRDMFKFSPPEMLVLELVLGTAKLAWDTAAQRRRLLLAKQDMDRQLLARAGGDTDTLDGPARGPALCTFLQTRYWPDGATDEALADVAKQMGVGELLAPPETETAAAGWRGGG